MGFFNKISNNDSLFQALAKKQSQSDISDKTVTKLTEKINNASVREQWDAYSDVKKLKGDALREKMLSTFQNALLTSSRNTINHALDENLQHDTEINFIDEMYLPQIINSINAKRAGFNLRYFDDLNDLFNAAYGNQLGNSTQAVVRMKKKNDKSQIHYAALDYCRGGGNHFFMFYEPAMLSGNSNAGTDYGFSSLKDLHKVYLNKFYDKMRMSFTEMAIQSSPSDCGIFSLALANAIAKNTGVRKKMTMTMEPYKIKRFYQHGASNKIKFAGSKIAISVPESYLKHSNSISLLRNLDTKLVVNKKDETLVQRAERHLVNRDGITYSNSIEDKRRYFFDRHLGTKSV